MRLNLEFVRNFHNQEILTDFRISPIQRHHYITSSYTYYFLYLFPTAVSLCASRISKTYPSFLTVKEGSTFLTKPLFPQGREDVTALRCSEPLRYKVGGPIKGLAMLCGMGLPSYYLAKGAGYYPYFKTTLSCNKSQRERNVFNV